MVNLMRNCNFVSSNLNSRQHEVRRLPQIATMLLTAGSSKTKLSGSDERAGSSPKTSTRLR